MKKTLFLILLFVTVSAIEIKAQPSFTPTAKSFDASRWIKSNFSKGKLPPFAFKYGGKDSRTFIKRWKHSFVRKPSSEAGVSQYAITYTDPATKLEIKVDAKAFTDYGAVEWVMHLSNKGTANTPQISAFSTAAVSISGYKGKYTLHYPMGSTAARTDFNPVQKTLYKQGDTLRLETFGGRSSDGQMPFLNIETTQEGSATYRGVMFAMGWTGNWNERIEIAERNRMDFTAGMTNLNAYLTPGETIRTPLVSFLIWKGDNEFAGNNRFRRFMLNHHTHRINGKPTLYPITAGFEERASPSPCSVYSCLTEDWAKAVIHRQQMFGIKVESLWLDAGWYEGCYETDWFAAAGQWVVDKKRFPNNLTAIGDECHKTGEKFMVWFEPERCMPGTLFRTKKPAWILHQDGKPRSVDDDPNPALMNLAKPEVVDFISKYIGDFMERNNIDYYRQDFNINPAEFWAANSEKGRVGILEAKYVEGLYRFWDNILARFPKAIIDNCASGGRRIDLETSSRSASLWRTDYREGEPNGQQCHTYGLSLYLPQSGISVIEPSVYAERSAFGATQLISWRMTDPRNSVSYMKKAMAEIYGIRHYFLEDYYPLTGVDHDITGDNIFLAYQLNKPSDNTGYIVAFRRQECKDSTLNVHLYGLEANKTYKITNRDTNASVEKTGSELMKGFTIKADEPRRSVLLFYKAK